MPNLPIINLGKAGIVKDVEPWDDPWEAWSAGNNVRFEDGKAMRAPVHRTGVMTSSSPNLTDAAGITTFRPPTGTDQVFLLDSFGRINLANIGSTPTDVTEVAFTPVASPAQFTSCYFSGVLYVARATHAPRYWLQGSTKFAPIPTMDTPNWVSGIIRSLSSFLVVFGVTKGSSGYPTMVKWSDATSAGAPPASWDTTITTNLAGETILSQANGPIIDAQNLRNDLVIYTDRQIWLMEPTGDKTFVFNFRKLWDDPKWGAIGPNCSVEVDGLHYVFGSNDLYRHDGVSAPQSISSGRVKKWVYANMTQKNASHFFVCHDPYMNTVKFCFTSLDGEAHVKGATRCNRSADYNYRSDTWGFTDLPNAVGATIANGSPLTTWATEPAGQTWATKGGTWADLVDGYKPSLLLAGTSIPALPQSGYYAVDPIQRNSRTNLPIDALANWPSFVEHGGVSLSGNGLPVRDFKRIQSLMPTARAFNGLPITITLGASETTQGLPNYGPPQIFNATTDYQVDSTASGRYLAVRIDAATLCEWDLTMFDLELVNGGRR